MAAKTPLRNLLAECLRKAGSDPQEDPEQISAKIQHDLFDEFAKRVPDMAEEFRKLQLDSYSLNLLLDQGSTNTVKWKTLQIMEKTDILMKTMEKDEAFWTIGRVLLLNELVECMSSTKKDIPRTSRKRGLDTPTSSETGTAPSANKKIRNTGGRSDEDKSASQDAESILKNAWSTLMGQIEEWEEATEGILKKFAEDFKDNGRIPAFDLSPGV
eukprot:Rmarinus@m.5204